jgi:hypothetical protein
MNFMPSFSSISTVESNYHHWKNQGGGIGHDNGFVTGATPQELEETDREIGIFLQETGEAERVPP